MTSMRKYSRIPFVADALIETDKDKKRLRAHILDISLKGVLVAVEGDPPSPGAEPYTLRIQLAKGGAAICMKVITRNRDGNRLGCEWTRIDIESMTRLRRLLELNLADSELIERELHQLRHL